MRRVLQAVLACVAATACTHGMAVPTCTVATSAMLSFGVVVALASTGPVSSNTAGSFWINCTSDVTTAPSLSSATPRTLTFGANSLAFSLSAVAPGAAELPSAPPGAPLGFARNGANQTVTLHGRIDSADFRWLPAGTYAGSIVLTLEY